MGTRHLIAVQLDGKYRIAQYGQWDGYPSGQGATVVKFLRSWNRPLFEEKVRATSFLTDAEMEEINATIKRENLGENWKRRWPHLSRDAGAEILQMVQDAEPGIKLKDSINFAADSLFCEWAYVIDLDKNTFEIFQGFNKAPLAEGERFYGAKAEDTNPEYHPVKLRTFYVLTDIPTAQQLATDCESSEDAS